MAGGDRHEKEMRASCSDGRGGLLAGLPDELVFIAIITRLPWFTRPVCRAVSKAWRAWIDASTKSPEALIRSREHHLPLVQGCCQTRYEELGSGYRRLRWGWPPTSTCKVDRRWRELPSLRKFFPQRPRPMPKLLMRMASAGIVYVWTEEPPHEFVVKMDVAGGDWDWKKIPLPHTTARPISFNGEIYLLSYDSLSVRLARGKSCGMVLTDELYSPFQHGSSTELTLDILAFDDCKESWRATKLIAIPDFPEWANIEDVQLVNGDCFEPAPDEGINAVWVDYEGSAVRWYNPSVRQSWFEFKYDAESKCLVRVHFTHGWLYGCFLNIDRDRDEGNNFGWKKLTCTYMKGKMVVEQNQLVWEQSLGVEPCFQELDDHDCVECYRVMM